ncbi:MAG: DUF488 family protein [Geobacteraceae bacterium]|nr:DUF488 family protein [Geobacteraceae bacterium]
MDSGDGRRFLVKRLWPGGVEKEDLSVDGWVNNAAPSDALRKWFGHDPATFLYVRNLHKPTSC